MSQFEPTPEQNLALTTPAPLLVLAGAGTGKTTVLTRRVAQAIVSGQARPDQVLALTFTDKAAAEMAERLAEVLGEIGQVELAQEATVGTFHSFGGLVIRENLLRLGFHRSPAVLASAANWRLLSSIFDELDFTTIEISTEQIGKLFGNLLHFISQSKDHLVSPDDLDCYLDRLASKSFVMPVEEYIQERLGEWRDAAAAYRRYEVAKQEHGFIDFGDHLYLAARLLAEDTSLRDAYRRRFRFVFVDEYQDTNHAQRLLLLQLIDPRDPQIMVIGDDDQAIYRWRGAVVQNILRFPEERVFRPGQVTSVPMTQNRRSYPPIIDLANLAITRVGHRHQKMLGYHPSNGERRAVIGHYLAASDRDEARWIAQQIQALEPEARTLPGKKLGYGAFAILCRRRSLFQSVGKALEDASIPFELVGGTGFYGRWEIRDIISYLRLMEDSSDEVALARILRSPRWRISSRDIFHLGTWVSQQNHQHDCDDEERPKEARLHLFDAVRHRDEVQGLSPGARERLTRLVEELEGFSEARQRLDPANLVTFVIESTGYRRELQARLGFDARVALLNLAKLESVAEEFAHGEEDEASLAGFIEYVNYALESEEEEGEVRPVDEEADTVKVITVHQAKGLEFPIVFIPGLSERIFPGRGRDESGHWREIPWELRGDRDYLHYIDLSSVHTKKDLNAALDARKQAEKALQLDEERRLFYVAVTRAQRQLYLSRAHWYGTNKKWRAGSEFWDLVVRSSYSHSLGEEECPIVNPNLMRGGSEVEVAVGEATTRAESVSSLLLDGRDGSARIEAKLQEDSNDWQVRLHELDEHLERLRLGLPISFGVATVDLTCSALLLYWTCPRRYRYLYVDHLPRRPSPYAALGIELHRRIEELSRLPITTPKDEPDEPEDSEEPRHVEFEVEEIVEAAGKEERASSARAGVNEMLATYQSSLYGLQPATYVEMPFHLPLKGGSLRGRIDRLDYLANDAWRLVDFKTGLPSDHAISVYRKQLGVYALAISRGWGVQASRLCSHLFFLSSGTDIGVVFEDAELDLIRDEAERAIAAIAREDLPLASDVITCRYCDYVHLCGRR